MGFFGKVKQLLGIGGVKVEVECERSVAKSAGIIQGAVGLTAKSDQEVLSIHVKLIEEWSTGRGENKQERIFELGEVKLPGGFTMKAQETRKIDFALPFSLVKSNADELKEMGGALGKLGSVAAFANAEKSSYKVVAEADVKGTAIDPSGEQVVQLV